MTIYLRFKGDLMEDLELKGLGQFIGTLEYHKAGFFKSNLTDGIAYLMENGYSWFITDTLAVIELKFKDEEFLAINLKVKDSKADMIITDGNEKVLYKQHYNFTDAKRDLKLFYTNNVMMLASEY